MLLVGAGPVGLEFAGEIKTAWPEKRVTLVDRNNDLMPGSYPDEFRTLLRKQLDELGIVITDRPVDADLRFDCFGATPVTGFVDLPARRPDGRIAVNPDLVSYQPEPDAIVLPPGPHGGVSYGPEAGVLGPGQTAAIKAGFYLDQYRELLGQS
ncbi:FAD-dependent oxidoreductase [Actinoplanes sp. NPDC026619]|uniref:FAD-dependent oxidoreductase n=1 Tax=Actinoplanes sp. NPDC026619 TaxID=3155798 RepID=UPI0033CC528F